ncbi:MAG: phenylalanyl-tRNA synthetase beta chain, partial [Patescibacteria group bacterium]|nr:phenylalanyl-tRNA synthetase beta chain [Patescibacteria group bacterium]
MKVSLNLAQEYSNVDLLSIGTETILHKIGSQLGAVEEVIDWGSRYKNIVVAKVISSEKHPNADKLSVCLIDDGGAVKDVVRSTDNLVQVVCGAPNVREGLLVAWLPPGSTVPSSIEKDPFVLGSRELRGVVSNGMLASARELGISDDHNGILEIEPGSAKPGTPLGDLFSLNDTVIDCENKMFTHRPDCFGILGVARELAGINNLTFVSPAWYSLSNIQALPVTSSLSLQSKNQITEKVPRFMLQVVENVTVQASNIQRQSDLARLGSKPINTIVDSTNYYMHVTAQPTHAFDYDKVAKLCKGEVTVYPRMAHKGETLKLLNGKTITLTAADIVIATDTQAIALAGVMGGSETEVDEKTKNIIIECATFDMYTIRRTSMRYGLFTDAVTRFNKGQSPYQNPVVLHKIISELSNDPQTKVGALFDSGIDT